MKNTPAQDFASLSALSQHLLIIKTELSSLGHPVDRAKDFCGRAIDIVDQLVSYHTEHTCLDVVIDSGITKALHESAKDHSLSIFRVHLGLPAQEFGSLAKTTTIVVAANGESLAFLLAKNFIKDHLATGSGQVAWRVIAQPELLIDRGVVKLLSKAIDTLPGVDVADAFAKNTENACEYQGKSVWLVNGRHVDNLKMCELLLHHIIDTPAKAELLNFFVVASV